MGDEGEESAGIGGLSPTSPGTSDPAPVESPVVEEIVSCRRACQSMIDLSSRSSTIWRGTLAIRQNFLMPKYELLGRMTMKSICAEKKFVVFKATTTS